MQANHLRILELRDRLRTEPAPFIYAQLAEEYRRARDADEAVAHCRECLARYPAYLSIRVILGRALAERGELDAAAAEFERVLTSAPENLTATRDLAEIELRRGDLPRALELYRRALALFQGDVQLEERVRVLAREVAEGRSAGESVLVTSTAREADLAPAGVPAASHASVDFDEILTSLGAKDQQLPPLMEMLLSRPGTARPPGDPVPDEPGMQAGPEQTPAPAERGAILTTLQNWLAAVERRRAARSQPDRHANRST